MDLTARIYVSGHRGLVGSAIVRRLKQAGADNLLLRTRSELDLTDQAAVQNFFAAEKPAHVFLAAAHVGGIHANDTYPAEFIRDNLAIQTNVIHSSWQNKVQKLVFLGSSCIYPRMAPQPMHEDSLLTGPLEPTNEWYAIAKIAGIKMCQAYRKQYDFDAISLMPTNLYGPGDNFHPENSHVLPAMIRRFHEAKQQGTDEVTIWGSGKPLREFLHVDDLAEASLHAMCLSKQQYQSVTEPTISHLNVGAGEDITISDLANRVSEIVGFQGQIIFNTDYPDGTPRKLLDVSKMSSLGWQASITLRQGIASTYAWFKDTVSPGPQANG